MKYILSKSVFFRQYGENTIVYNTNDKNVFVFDGCAFDILNIFSNYNSIEECLNVLNKKYNLTKEDRTGISSLILQLVNMKILKCENILTEQKDNIEAYHRSQLLPENTLYAVQFELTFRCNERCKHCYCVTDKPLREELSTKEIKNILDDLYDMGVFEVTFTGGDLFVRKDTFEILEYAYSKKFLVNIFTNGIALSAKDFIKLKSLNLKSIHFSIYNYIPEKHDAFTQVKGSFEKTINAIKTCVTLNIPTNIKTCVNEENAQDIEGILKLAKELDTTIQISMSLTAKNDGDLSPFQYRLKTPEDYAKIMCVVNNNIVIHCSGDYKQIRPDNGQICGAGSNSLNINPYGDVFPCNSLLINCGNIKEKSIKNIWENSTILKNIRQFTIDKVKGCENCDMLGFCNFCPGSALTETGDPLQKYSEACILTKAKKLSNNY